MRFEPVASTNSILYKMYKEANIDISRETALLMIS
jgi:inorganic pyrophosphatase/exopolyphosphatase